MNFENNFEMIVLVWKKMFIDEILCRIIELGVVLWEFFMILVFIILVDLGNCDGFVDYICM